MDNKIKSIKALEVLDSRGNPTVKVILKTSRYLVNAAVPSGASTGTHESFELRDNGNRYNGKGVLKAVNNVKKIANKIKGVDFTNQTKIDQIMLDMDGTKNKSKLGANAILAVSIAACKAGALHNNMNFFEYIKKISKTKTVSLPIPQLNIINGGEHIGIKNDIQEHMIMPIKFKSFKEALRASVETYHELRSILKRKYGAQATLIGDEGGFAPIVNNIDKRLELIDQAIDNSGYKNKIFLALDCAASEFLYGGNYKIRNKKYSSGQLIDFYKDLVKRYKIISIEDGMAEDDWEGWRQLNKELGGKIQIVGDDLLVTNVSRIEEAIKKKSCNSLLLKVNQTGTVTESIEAAKLAFKNKWNVIVSHRSGGTRDSFIADLVVGLNSGQSKFGAPARSERTAKYNRLLEIEDTLGSKAKFARLR